MLGVWVAETVLEEIIEKLNGISSDAVVIERREEVPSRESVLANGPVFQVDAAILSMDMREYSGMTNAFGRRVAVEMVRGFFAGVTRISAVNGGKIADFNGDGMIVAFSGDDRVDRAIRSAGQSKWFVDEILRPRYDSYFTGTQLVPDGERVAMFDAGFAVDEGVILVCGVGQGGRDDPVWVGAAVNRSAKLCKLARYPGSIMITREAFDRLNFRSHDSFDSGWLVVSESIKVGGVRNDVLVNERSIPLDE
jgi:class 3 adenylate cyclase